MMNKLFKNRRLPAGILSVIIAFSILLSTFSGLAIFADTTGGTEPWDGTAATEFKDGAGTKENPYIVSTPAELLLAVSSTGMDGDKQLYYKMVNDIYVNDVSSANWKADTDLVEWPVVSTQDAMQDSAFGGVFNGNGYKVFGLFVSKSYSAPENGALDESVATGLFPAVTGAAKISAVGVEESYFSLTNNDATANKAYAGIVGVIAGYVHNATSTTSAEAPIAIDRCYVADSVSIKAVYAGLVGKFRDNNSKSVVITNCYGLASATVHAGVSGNRFILATGGNNAGCAKMEYNFSTGGISFNSCNSDTKANYASNWVGSSTGVQVALANMKGKNAFNESVDENEDGTVEKAERYMTLLKNSDAFMLTDSFPILRIFLRTESGEKLWDGSVTAPETGDGSETNPYIIENASQLAYVIKNGGETDKIYKLVNDIYLNDPVKIDWSTGEADTGYTPNEWLHQSDAPDFKGTIDGDGHIIYGLYYNQTGTVKYSFKGCALIPYVKENSIATVKNLGIDNAYISTNQSAGGFFGGNSKGTVNVENSYVGENVTLKGHLAGAFVAGSSGKINFTDSYSLATTVSLNPTATDSYVGLCGDVYGKFESSLINCYNAKGGLTTRTSSLPKTLENVYATQRTESGQAKVKLITAENMQGMDALTNPDKMSGLGDKYTATTTYPILKIFAAASTGDQNKYWDGKSSYAPIKGEGTEAAPYEIENAFMLAYVIKNGGEGKYYKLTDDVYLNKEDGVNWLTGEAVANYTPNSWFDASGVTAFSGTLDGDGHTVYGLYYSDTAEKEANGGLTQGVGLIPAVKSGTVTVKNLGIDSAYINYSSNVGAIIAFNKGGTVTVEQSYVGADVYLSANDCGAILGTTNSNMTINSCYSLATVVGARYGGFIADAYGKDKVREIESCYNANGTISSKNISSSLSKNSYATVKGNGATVLTADKMQGLEVLTAEDKMKNLAAVGTYHATEGFPILRVFLDTPLPPIGEDEGTIWNGNTATFFAQGSGTEADPYVITKGSELALMLSSGGNDAYYKLGADIYLNDVTADKWYEKTTNNEWLNNVSFSGTFDGDGHIVYGIWYAKDNTYTATGLIPVFSKGTVKNVGVRHSYIFSDEFAGGIVGTVGRGSLKTISQCFADETVWVGYTSTKNKGAAGILGSIDSDGSNSASVRLLIENCYSKAYVTGADGARTNGLIGTVWKSAVKVVNSYSTDAQPYIMRSNGTVSSLYWDYSSGKYTEGAAGITDINNVLSGIYSDTGSPKTVENYTVIGADALRVGADQPTLMPAFDFNNIWVAVDGGTPKLKIFDSISGKDIDAGWSGKDDDDSGSGGTGSGTDSDVAFEGGTGTSADPYIIKSVEQLRAAVTSTAGKFYKLANDISVNDTSARDWYTKTNNVEWVKDTKFKGSIDGDGHCVYGIWYPENNTSKYAGLIPVFQGGTIKNLGLRYSYIYAKEYAGGIVGMASGTNCSLLQCFADDSVMVGYNGTGSYGAGGIMGYAQSGSSTTQVRILIENCYSKAQVTGAESARTNGLIGTVWKSAVKVVNSYSVNASPYYMRTNGTVSSLYWDYSSGKYTSGAAGITDINNVLSGVYTDAGNGSAVENYTNINADALRKGADQPTLMPALDFTGIWKAVDGGTPVLRMFEGLDGKDIDVSRDGLTYSGGTGKASDPYIIKTVEQLRYLVESVNTKNKYYKLANDLYINDTSKAGWMNAATEKWYHFDAGKGTTFDGNFDGDGHFIYGIYVNQTPTTDTKMNNAAAGLFPKMSMYATVRNVHVRDSYISGVGYVGSIVGYISASGNEYFGRIIGCSADHTVTLKGQTVGGLLGGGGRNLEIHYSYFTGNIEATSQGRGNALVGDIWNTQQRVIQAYSIGYTNYRTSFVPSLVKGLYGTVAQSKTTLVSETNLYGAAAKEAMPDFNWDIWYTVDGKTPHMKVITDDMLVELYGEGEKGKVWSGLMATKFAGGTGTENDPYLIETPEQMVYFVQNVGSSKGKFYKLTADLKLNDTSKAGWEATANSWITTNSSFAGTLDGDGHVVSGLYYNGSDATIALIPKIAEGAVIKRLGVTKSTIINPATVGEQSYTAAIVGQISGLSSDNPETFKNPVISECFANDSVYLEGHFVGGIVGGGSRSIDFENCYFTGNIVAEDHCGAIFGNQWNGRLYASSFTNCYAVTPERVSLGGNQLSNKAVLRGVYLDGKDAAFSNLVLLSINLMKGDDAKENMPELDYVNVWKTVKGGTPVLRCFKDAEQYSSVQPPRRVEISFATEGGETVEAIYGETGTKIGELPVPTYYAHNFKGWYVNRYKVIPFELEDFPNFDMVLYAKWERYGFDQGFETDIDTQYDINEGIEIFRPGSQGYNPKQIHSGMRALRTIPESAVDPIFLLNYQHPLEIGMKYDVTFWVYTRDGAQGNVDFLHANHPQVDSPIVGYTTEYDLSNLKKGAWTQIKTTIVANAPYILVRTSKGAEVFFDDFQMVPTFEEGKLGELEGFNPDDISGEPAGGLPIVWLIVIIAGGVILLGGIAATVILLVKKNKKTA